MKATKTSPFLQAICVLLICVTLFACKKDSDSPNNNNNNTGFFKGNIASNPWEHGCILRDNGTARYYISFSGGAMTDTANSNVSKFEGTYNIVSGVDSIYINCNQGDNNFKLKGIINSARTSISGIWAYSTIGITNTLPFTMAK
jgi:hypothetical protein